MRRRQCGAQQSCVVSSWSSEKAVTGDACVGKNNRRLVIDKKRNLLKIPKTKRVNLDLPTRFPSSIAPRLCKRNFIPICISCCVLLKRSSPSSSCIWKNRLDPPLPSRHTYHVTPAVCFLKEPWFLGSPEKIFKQNLQNYRSTKY